MWSTGGDGAGKNKEVNVTAGTGEQRDSSREKTIETKIDRHRQKESEREMERERGTLSYAKRMKTAAIRARKQNELTNEE